MTLIDLDKLEAITPRALAIHREICRCANATLTGFGILENERRAAHFWAQILHESSGLTRFVENMNYSAKRIRELGQASPPGSRWRSLVPRADELANNPREMANAIYGGRLGNTLPDDGWTFIGRGLIQLTGRANYRRIGAGLNLNLVDNPSLVVTAEFALPVAAEFWRQADCNRLADLDDIVKVTRAINGGTIGLDDRKRWLEKMRRIVLEGS